MKFKQSLFTSLAGACALASVASQAAAKDALIVHSGPQTAEGYSAKFAVFQHLQPNVHSQTPPAFPATWVFTYVNGGKTFNETFVGTDPAGGLKTTVPVYIVPTKMVYGTTSYDPTTVQANSVSVIQNVVNSPIFAKIVDFKSGVVTLGKTQYLDAFQRANLWGTVKTHKTYHVLLKAVIKPVQTITVPTANGKIINAFGASNLIMENINTFDPVIEKLIKTLKIPPNALPLFITTQTYLASGNTTSGCCIGGYHSVNASGQPYGMATYITTSGAFSQNVSALSHEIGEWVDDPLTNNAVPAACGTGAILEVGDPLEGGTNYGDYAYPVAGVTWDLQDLVELPYFGAPAATTANGYTTFQGQNVPFCSNGG